MVLFRAPHTAVSVADAAQISVDASTLLESEFSAASATAIEARMKNVTVAFPEGDVEIVPLLGETSNFQNAEIDDKPFGLAELTGTFIVTEDELLAHNSKHLFFGSATAVGGTHSRYQPGKTDGSGTFSRPTSSWLVKLDDGTDELMIVLDAARITKMGDIKLDSADGHWEFEVTVKCLPQNVYMEWKD